jgi:AcrR family transcriptional regulator
VTTKTAAPSVPPLRRDAAENRRLVLDAAARVFAEHGLEASVEHIAQVAGVGIGTLYRRFPTKDALVAELVRDVLSTLCQLAADATDQPDGSGLEHFLVASSEYQAEHRGCLPRLWNADADDVAVHEVRRTIATLLDDAKHHGVVRQDLTSTDLTLTMWSIRGVIETTRDVAPDAWRRHLDLLLAGMRPTDQPFAHRPISRAQVDKVLASESP